MVSFLDFFFSFLDFLPPSSSRMSSRSSSNLSFSMSSFLSVLLPVPFAFLASLSTTVSTWFPTFLAIALSPIRADFVKSADLVIFTHFSIVVEIFDSITGFSDGQWIFRALLDVFSASTFLLDHHHQEVYEVHRHHPHHPRLHLLDQEGQGCWGLQESLLVLPSLWHRLGSRSCEVSSKRSHPQWSSPQWVNGWRTQRRKVACWYFRFTWCYCRVGKLVALVFTGD